MDALLIIDMQNASFTQVERYDAVGTIRRINDLGIAVRESVSIGVISSAELIERYAIL